MGPRVMGLVSVMALEWEQAQELDLGLVMERLQSKTSLSRHLGIADTLHACRCRHMGRHNR
jgi:hypothetical protein